MNPMLTKVMVIAGKTVIEKHVQRVTVIRDRDGDRDMKSDQKSERDCNQANDQGRTQR